MLSSIEVLAKGGAPNDRRVIVSSAIVLLINPMIQTAVPVPRRSMSVMKRVRQFKENAEEEWNENGTKEAETFSDAAAGDCIANLGPLSTNNSFDVAPGDCDDKTRQLQMSLAAKSNDISEIDALLQRSNDELELMRQTRENGLMGHEDLTTRKISDIAMEKKKMDEAYKAEDYPKLEAHAERARKRKKRQSPQSAPLLLKMVGV